VGHPRNVIHVPKDDHRFLGKPVPMSPIPTVRSTQTQSEAGSAMPMIEAALAKALPMDRLPQPPML